MTHSTSVEMLRDHTWQMEQVWSLLLLNLVISCMKGSLCQFLYQTKYCWCIYYAIVWFHTIYVQKAIKSIKNEVLIASLAYYLVYTYIVYNDMAYKRKIKQFKFKERKMNLLNGILKKMLFWLCHSLHIHLDCLAKTGTHLPSELNLFWETRKVSCLKFPWYDIFSLQGRRYPECMKVWRFILTLSMKMNFQECIYSYRRLQQTDGHCFMMPSRYCDIYSL